MSKSRWLLADNNRKIRCAVCDSVNTFHIYDKEVCDECYLIVQDALSEFESEEDEDVEDP